MNLRTRFFKKNKIILFLSNFNDVFIALIYLQKRLCLRKLEYKDEIQKRMKKKNHDPIHKLLITIMFKQMFLLDLYFDVVMLQQSFQLHIGNRSKILVNDVI